MSAPAAAPPATPWLEAHDVTVRFRGLTALDNVSLQVPAGKVAGLIGPNGAGKSTMLAVLSGLLRPNGGRVSLLADDVTTQSPQARARRGLARTFQHPELFPGLTVREHLVIAHRAHAERGRIWTDLVTWGGFRRPSAEETERVDALLDALDLGAIAHQPVVGQPLGVTRMIELGRALATSPSVLLLDEPSSGMDVHETTTMIETLHRVAEARAISMLLVEHDVDMVLRMCSLIYVLDFGKLIASGTPAEIRSDPAVRASYFGTGNVEATS